MDNSQQDHNNNPKSTEEAEEASITELTQNMTVEEVAQDRGNFTQNSLPDSLMWQPGDELKNGKYIIEKELGRGGFGVTYLAINHQGDPVVIKILKDELRDRDGFDQLEEDFVNEAVKLSRFNHPNIVPIIEVIKDNNRQCIVMKYIKGKTLEAFVQERNDYLSPKEALHYIKEIGVALKVVHAQGLLHRDVKPQNILIQEDTSNAILIDFGLALNFDRNPIANSGSLSHGYAPLEQYQHNVIWDYYTDVYALAATLYFVLTKTKPISARQRASANRLVPAKDLNPKISNHLSETIDRGMSLDPASRPETVEQWLELLNKSPRKLTTGWKALIVVFSLGLGVVVYLIVNGQPGTGELKFGQTIQRKCTNDDLHTLTRKCNEEYFLEGKKGDKVTLEMNSNEIDPLLILMDVDGNVIAKSDDIDVNDFNAKITKELPEDGSYRIMAQSSQEQELGAYTLSLTKN